MVNGSKVYWAPPGELAALANSKKNMNTNNLIKTRLVLDEILDIQSGDKVAVKVHVGEAYNTRYLRHDYVHEVVKYVKSKGGTPTLVETQGIGMKPQHIKMSEDHVICLGCRKTAEQHAKMGHLHGYTETLIGAPLKFIDGEKGIEGKLVNINGIHFKDVSVAAGLFDFDKVVIVAHFKGHASAAFGGAMKQLGIGCVTKRNKFRAHFGKLKITKKCNPEACNVECIEACPVNAITKEGDKIELDESLCVGCLACQEYCRVKRALSAKFSTFDIFTQRMIDNVLGVVTGIGPTKIRYISFATDITLNCDCIPNPGPPVVPDLGIFGSTDPVAVDRACVDAETAAPGIPKMLGEGKWSEPIPPGVEKFQELFKICDASWQFEAAMKNKIGNIKYELINI